MRTQEPPFCIQIELAYGCNLACRFCGMQGAQARPGHGIHHMTMQTADVVARRIAQSGWNPRLEFARRGEPTLNPYYAAIINTFRQHNPKLQIMMTSNGGGLLANPGPSQRIETLFNAGLNILALDDYQNVGIIGKIRRAWEEQPPTYPVYAYPQQPEGNPHRRYPVRRTRFVSVIEDISVADKGTHSKINNHAGHGGPLVHSYNKPCAKPFREMGINFDGSVDLCCIDWISEYRIGNLHDLTLEQVWQHPRMQAARQYLLVGERSALRPCRGCDHPSYRTGLLPDPLGKATLPPPDSTAAAIVHAVQRQGPHHKPTRVALQRIGPTLEPDMLERWQTE